MPIYEYNCQQCDHQFSKRRSMSAADQPVTCPECGSPNTKRALSLFAAPCKQGNTSNSCSGCSSGSCSSCGQ